MPLGELATRRPRPATSPGAAPLAPVVAPRGGATARRGRGFYSVAIIPGLVRLLDLTLLASAGGLSFLFYFSVVHGVPQIWRHYPMVVVIGCAAYAVYATLANLYRLDRLHSVRWQASRAALGLGVAALALLLPAFLLKATEDYSRGWFVLWMTSSFCGLVVARLTLKAMLGQMARQGTLARRVAVLGTGADARTLRERLGRIATHQNLQLLGPYADREGPAAEGGAAPLDALVAEAAAGRVDSVVVALPWSECDRIAAALERLRPLPVDVCLAPDPVLTARGALGMTALGPVPLLTLSERPLKDWSALIKDLEDLVLASLALIVVSPILLAAAIAIRLEGPGPILFRQARFGFNNREFQVLKFRTMQVARGDATGAERTVRNDPRVTRVGRFLRRFSIDELPQLLNVLTGDMSLVGPRAHAVAMKVGDRYYFDAFQDYAARHRVRPGITGWAQVNGLRGEIDSIEKAKKRLEYDLYYVDNWSLAFDLSILARTVVTVLFDRSAY